MMIKMKNLGIGLSLLVMSWLFGAEASAQQASLRGGCIDIDLGEYVLSETNPDGQGINAVALMDGTQIFKGETDTVAADSLKMGEEVIIEADGANRVGIRRRGTNYDAERLLWTDKRFLRCQNRPLFDDATGLERKAVIRTETTTSESGKGISVQAYRTASMNDCGENCRKLSRFKLLFIVAETDKAVLLSNELRFIGTANSPFVGWVEKKSIYEWPYSVGLRPKRDLVHEDGPGTVCGYLTLEEARSADKSKCQPILGGYDWFKTATRLLVMKQHETDGGPTIYETVAPITGRAAKAGTQANADGTLLVDPTDLRGADADVLKRQNRIDLFFLIDGTRSMAPYIDAIRGTAQQDGLIKQMLTGFQAQISSGVTFRAGFRIFRDTNNPARPSVSEGMALPDQDCKLLTPADVESNFAEFERNIATVQVTDETNDDYSEDMMGGLAQALRDIRSCPENKKIVFVISDAGYDPDKQASRGKPVVDPQKLTSRFDAEFKSGLMFFMRPPRDNAPKNRERYKAAFDDFRNDAMSLMSTLRIVNTEPGTKPKDYFIDLNLGQYEGAGLVGQINRRVIKPNANPDAIAELEIDLQGGRSLVQAIERLRKERQDIPAYFWRLVEESACKDLGEACRKETFQSVREVFIRGDENKIELDVWMDQKKLRQWISFVQLVQETTGVQEARTAMRNGIDKALRTVIREPEYNSDEETIGEYMLRAGVLPIGFKTPLLGYSLADLAASNKVSSCEVLDLKAWLTTSEKLLTAVQSARQLPVYTERGAEDLCPGVSKAGQRVKLPTGAITIEQLAEGMTLAPTQEGDFSGQIYWVPQRYLP